MREDANTTNQSKSEFQKWLLGLIYDGGSPLPFAADLALSLERAVFKELLHFSDFREAESRLHAAREWAVQRNNKRMVAELDHMLSVVYSALGDERQSSSHSASAVHTMESQFNQAKGSAKRERLARAEMLPALVAQGIAFEQKGEYERALEVHERAAASARALFGTTDWRDTPCVAGVARVLRMLGRFEESEALCREVLDKRRRLMPSNHDLIASAELALGSLYLAMDKCEEAKEVLKSGLAILRHSDNALQLQIQEGTVDLALVLWRLDELDEALAAFNDALKLNSKSTDMLLQRGTLLLQLDNINAAMADYTEAVRLQPDLAEAYCSRGVAHARLREFERAIADYDRAIALDRDLAIAYINRADVYYLLGKYQNSVDDCDEAIRLDPEIAMAHCNRGKGMLELLEVGQALMDLSKAIQLDPELGEAHYYLGKAREKCGSIPLAQQSFEEADRLGYKFRHLAV